MSCGLHALFRQRLQEKIKRDVLILVTIGEWHLNKGAVAIDHPRLRLLRATGKLRAHGASMKGVVKGDEILLMSTVFGQSIRFRPT